MVLLHVLAEIISAYGVDLSYFTGNSHRRRNIIWINLNVIQKLISEWNEGFLQSTARVSNEEQLMIFLYFAGQRPSNRQMQESFQHSSETITR
jgi:hypothetical protein